MRGPTISSGSSGKRKVKKSRSQ